MTIMTLNNKETDAITGSKKTKKIVCRLYNENEKELNSFIAPSPGAGFLEILEGKKNFEKHGRLLLDNPGYEQRCKAV